MNRKPTPTGQAWLDSGDLGMIFEADACLAAGFHAPAARRDYLTRLAQWRAERSGKIGSSADELSKRARLLILHLNRLQRKAEARAERESLVHPALRFAEPKPVEDEGLLPIKQLRAEADAARPEGDRAREAERLRKRRKRAEAKAAREALAA